jgi:hypothetical protein
MKEIGEICMEYGKQNIQDSIEVNTMMIVLFNNALSPHLLFISPIPLSYTEFGQLNGGDLCFYNGLH